MSAFAPNAPTISVAVPCLPRASVVKPFSIATFSPSSPLLLHDMQNFDVKKCTCFLAQSPRFTLNATRRRQLRPAFQRANVSQSWPENPSPAPKHARQSANVNKSDVVMHTGTCAAPPRPLQRWSLETVQMWGNVGVFGTAPCVGTICPLPTLSRSLCYNSRTN